MNSRARYETGTDVVYRDFGGEAVLLNLETGIYFGLDAVGTRVWQLLREHQSVEAILPVLLSEYEVGEQELRADVLALVAELLEHRLLILQRDQD